MNSKVKADEAETRTLCVADPGLSLILDKALGVFCSSTPAATSVGRCLRQTQLAGQTRDLLKPGHAQMEHLVRLEAI